MSLWFTRSWSRNAAKQLHCFGGPATELPVLCLRLSALEKGRGPLDFIGRAALPTCSELIIPWPLTPDT